MEVRYFDNAATTRVKEEVLEEMFPFLSVEYGNPSSIYGLGRSARKAVEEARRRVASLIGAEAREIYFTSCGSESDNMALKGLAYQNARKGSDPTSLITSPQKNHIITSKIEHPAILNTCHALEKQGFEVTYLDVSQEGIICLDSLERAIKPETFLISIMFANNEIGTIEPIEAISRIAHSHGIYFHTDAVQAVGNIPINVKQMGIDLLSLSGHKLYAPKGIGALYVKQGIEIERFLDGGHQEKNKRAGTENVAEIVALGKACELAEKQLPDYQMKLRSLRDDCLHQMKLRFPELQVNGSLKERLPGNCNVCFPKVNSSELLYKLDQVGICASGGSACSSGDTAPSHVLTAIGVPSELAQGALRITFGDFNTKQDVDFLIQQLDKIIWKK